MSTVVTTGGGDFALLVREWQELRRETAEALITSRLLVLQSKRLMLHFLESHADDEAGRERSDVMRGQTATAQHAYRTAVFNFGTPDSPDFWIVVYGRLIDVGNNLVGRLRSNVGQLPAGERFEVSADVEALEELIGGWTESMRAEMAARIA